MQRVKPGPGHMASYITPVFICDTCDEDARKALKKCRIYKSFHFSLHGWMDHHTAVVQVSTGQIDANGGGRHTAKILKKIFICKEKEREYVTMNSLVLLIVCVAILIAGYIFYGGWLCKQWGVGDNKTETPAHTMEDGVDYVPAKAPVLMGHHFSSIAGAGPITGPIGAAMFGWLPVTLWILVGGIFLRRRT